MDETPPSSEESSCQEVRNKARVVCAAINRYKEHSVMPPQALWPLIRHLALCGDCKVVVPKLAPNYRKFLSDRENSLLAEVYRVVTKE
jgi:hypothetical protein